MKCVSAVCVFVCVLYSILYYALYASKLFWPCLCFFDFPPHSESDKFIVGHWSRPDWNKPPPSLHSSPSHTHVRTQTHTGGKQKCGLIACCRGWWMVTCVWPLLLSLSHSVSDGHQNTNQWSFSHPARCLWVWIIQFVSTKAAFVIAAMCSQALYPGCFALYSLIHHIRWRLQEINPHTGKSGDGVFFTALPQNVLLYIAVEEAPHGVLQQDVMQNKHCLK